MFFFTGLLFLPALHTDQTFDMADIHTREYYKHTHIHTHTHTHTHTRVMLSDQTFDMADMFLDMADMTDIFLDMLLPKSKFLKGVGRASANIFSSENALGVCAV